MQLEVQHIDPNDFVDWDEFTRYKSPDPYDDFAWFTLTIGIQGEEGGNNFQVLVATPAAVARAKSEYGRMPGVVADRFDSETVERSIRGYVSSLRGLSWDQFVDQLRQTMIWEYEGMGGG